MAESTWEELKTFLGLSGNTADDLVADCHNEAVALVAQVNKKWDTTEETWVASDAPDSVVRRAELAVGAELYNQSKTKNGIAQFAALDEQPVRVARDPLTPAYPLLAPWVVFGV